MSHPHKYPDNVSSLAPHVRVCFFFSLFISDDNFVPTLFHTPAVPLRSLTLTTHSRKCGSLLWRATAACCWLIRSRVVHLGLKNYQLELSVSSQLLCVIVVERWPSTAAAAAAARSTGCFSWLRWKLAAASPLATNLSAPGSCVSITQVSDASAADLAAALSAAPACTVPTI